MSLAYSRSRRGRSLLPPPPSLGATVDPAPPVYQPDDLATPTFVPPLPELPPYAGRRSPIHPQVSQTNGIQPAEFKYGLNRKGKAWATLKVFGNAIFSKQLPTILGNEKVSGEVTLNLESPDSIQALSISITGKIITGAGQGNVYTFLDFSTPLWSRAMGDPRRTDSPPREKFRGKLQGEYFWPYSFTLPQELSIPFGPRNESHTYHLPQSFLERHTRASIQYDLILHIMRGKLRPDNRLETTFVYIPISKPEPFSLLRQLAYQENSPLMGPDADPDGWHTSAPVSIRGTVFQNRVAEVHCTLSLAKPLCYTRGSILPCFLVIQCKDLQAIDLLSSPRSVVVRLRRCVKYHGSGNEGVEGLRFSDDIDYTESASWWPAMEGATDETYKRFLSGEIRLKQDLKPSSSIVNFRIEYSVVMFPFDATAFVPSSAEGKYLLEEPVEIVTAYGSGPRPHAYSPPIYNRPIPL